MNRFLRNPGLVAVIALLVMQVFLFGAKPAKAAPGDLIADVLVPEAYPQNISPSVAFDGRYLYYVDYGGSILHRIDVPPAGAPTDATGHVDIPVSGGPSSGLMTLSYDGGRDAFWAVSGDSLSIYTLSKTGTARLAFTIDPNTDRPGFDPSLQFANEIKIAYDGTDDTIWYSPDAMVRIYHYATYPDAQGTAAPITATPYIDLDVPGNDMTTECGYSQSSGVAVGGTDLFVSVAGCPYIFEYTKTGHKVASYRYPVGPGQTAEDLECDNVSYGVSVFWLRDGYDGHIRALEQPAANACRFGGAVATTPPQLVLTTTATPIAGSSFSFTVTARDQFGSIATGYTGSVHFTSTDSSAGRELPADSTLTNGQGTFSAILTRAGSQTITATDTANASISGTLSVTVRAASASRFVLSMATSTPTAGATFSFSVTAQDLFGNTDTAYAGAVHFTSSDTSSGVALPRDSTLTNGQGTFSATLITAGSQSVTATDTVTASLTATATITVNAASAASLSLSGPSSSTAGQALAVAVTLRDAYGNIATGYAGRVHFSSSDTSSGRVLPADSTLTNGQGTFSATLTRAGSQTITATDTANASLTSQISVSVRAASASRFILTTGTSTPTAGTSFSFSVTAQDPYGNIATGYGGRVHFSSSDTSSGRVLPADSTLTNGQGTFSATLTRAGSQTITGSDAGITGTVSVTVSAANPSSLTLAGPASSTAGQSFTVTVTLKDAYGNAANGRVHFTSSDTSSGVVLPADSNVTSGQGTFSATLIRAGAQTVTATETANAGVVGTLGVSVSAASPSSLTLAGPASSTAGQSFTITVTLKDAYGNGANGRVHFTSSDTSSGVVLPPDSNVTGGQGTFSVTLTRAGAQTVSATVNALSKQIGVSVNAAPASRFILTTGTSTPTAGTSFSLSVTGQDPYGNTDTAYAGTLHFTSSDTSSGRVLPADSTLTNGQGSFSATLTRAGSQTITATSGGVSGTASVTVRAAPASRFILSTGTSTPTAGTSFSFSVTAQDPYGNTDTAYAGTLHFTSSDTSSGRVLPADSTLASGQGTFSATLTRAGSQTVTGTSGSVTGTVSVTVRAASAATLTLTAPSSVAAGAAFTVTVQLTDRFGNIATGYTGTVHFSTSDPLTQAGDLPDDYTFSSADAGDRDFSAKLRTLTVPLVGTPKQTITVTDNGGLSDTTPPITVNAL